MDHIGWKADPVRTTAFLFVADQMEELVISAEICEDVWSPVPPSTLAAREGAIVIVNCSASDETIGKSILS